MPDKESPECARCPFRPADRLCKTENGKALPSCPTAEKGEILQKALEEYNRPEIHEFAKQAAIQEGEGYSNKESGYEHLKPAKPRIEEIMDFARKMKYQRLGLAFCTGLSREAAVVEKIFTANGFEVVSVICKAGRVRKEEIGIDDMEKVDPGSDESMCNPIFQAYLLNDADTEFNIMLGLCVGHDSLFLKYSDAPCTVLAVKDRLLGHNPLAAIYTTESYYRYLAGR